MDRSRGVWAWVRSLPWVPIGVGTFAAVVLIVVVGPVRRAVANVASKAILVAASPFAPGITGFDELSDASKVVAADGSQVGLLGAEQRDPVRLDQLPPQVPQAVLAAEDANFYHHSGVDPTGVFRALVNNVRGGSQQGGSTITQQLAKLNYVGSNRTIFRKFKEVLYASKLESKYSKNELLERYLNQVYFGAGAYGIAQASQTFFGVPPAQLTPTQAATVAGKIRSPNGLDPYTDPTAVQARRDQVLRSMAQHAWLSSAELGKAEGSPLAVVAAPKGRGAGSAGKAPDFVAYVGREVVGIDALGSTADARQKQAFTGGYTFETTVDLKATDAAVAAAKAILGAPGDPTTAIASVQPGDGAIRVLFGGLDPDLEFDPSSQGRRQPGSSFKPYVYMAMLKAGIDPRMTYDSKSPQTLRCNNAPWSVNNFEGEGGGMLAVDPALAESVNVVFAQIMTKVGPPAVASVAEKAGISHDEVNPAECAMALGGLRQGVSPLEQASGFATFAAKGVAAEPYSILRIKDRSGKVIYEHKPKTTQAFKDKEAGVLTAALRGVVDTPGGTGGAAQIGRPLAGKTGTTENYGNAWFVGYVPQLSTAVWVGRPEGDVPMRNIHGINVTGGTYPARIFGNYMKAALAGVPVQQLYTASPDDLGLKSSAPSTVAPPSTSSTLDSTTTTSEPYSPFPTTTSTLPPATVPRPTTTVARPTTAPRPATTVVPSTTTTTVR